jgi:hypothetical protein
MNWAGATVMLGLVVIASALPMPVIIGATVVALVWWCKRR